MAMMLCDDVTIIISKLSIFGSECLLCGTVLRSGDDLQLTITFSEFWLHITVPVPTTGDDVTIIFSVVWLYVAVLTMMSDDAVEMSGSINEASSSVSVLEANRFKGT